MQNITLHISLNNPSLMYLNRSSQSLVNNSCFHFAGLLQHRRSNFNSVMVLTLRSGHHQWMVKKLKKKLLCKPNLLPKWKN